MALPIYKHKPIDLASDAIRLVRIFKGYFAEPIRCELFETFLHEVDGVPYEALSYAWGGSSKPGEVILNACTAKVTKSLYTALQYLRLEHRDRVMWIDAICIDQDNIKEQGHQVGQMRTIYSKAEEVIIWLGLGSSNIDLLMDSMNQVHSNAIATTQNWTESSECWQVAWPIARHRLGGIHHTEIDAHVGDTLQELLERPWFRRVWVIQEVASARAASIMCGSKTISTRTFAQIPPLLDIKPDHHTQAVLDVMPGYLRKSTWWSHNQDLATLLQKFLHSEASDPRDKIYALLGISSDACRNEVFRPNYERTSNEVAQDTMRLLLFGTQTIAMGGTAHRECPLPAWSLPKLLENVATLAHDVLVWAIKGCVAETTRQLLKSRKLKVNSGFLASATLFCYVTDYGQHAEFIRAVLAREDVTVNLHHSFVESTNRERDAEVQLILEVEGIDVNLDQLLAKAAKRMDHTITELLLAHKNIDVNLGQPLAEAAKKGDDTTVKLLLAHKNIDVNLGQPLAEAASQGDDTTIGLLLAHQDIDATLGQPLTRAAANNFDSTVRLLLSDSNTDLDLDSPLAIAAEMGHYIIVGRLLAHDNAHTTALWDCVAIVMALLSHKDVDTIVHDLFEGPKKLVSYKLVNMLRNVGADVDTQDEAGRTLLSKVAESNSRLTTTLLLTKGANVHSPDNDGRTSLSWAASNRNGGDNGVIQRLLEEHADIESRDNNGRTPLSWAVREGSCGKINLLLQKGADIESRDNMGLTSLSWAAGNSQHQVVTCLLDMGANLESQDDNGRTALSWAAGEGRSQVVEYLVKKGANVDCRDSAGRTPLSWAWLGNQGGIICHLFIQKLLMKAGVRYAKENQQQGVNGNGI